MDIFVSLLDFVAKYWLFISTAIVAFAYIVTKGFPKFFKLLWSIITAPFMVFVWLFGREK